MSREDDARDLAEAYPDFPVDRLFRPSQLLREIEPGRFATEFPDTLRAGLPPLLDQYRELLLADDRDLLRRLYPTAYPDDEARNEEFARLMHDQLLEARLAGLDVVEATVERDELTTEEVDTWLRALNELRLVLGTRLDIGEDDPREDDPDDPDAGALDLYRLLGVLVGDLVDALHPTLPPADD